MEIILLGFVAFVTGLNFVVINRNYEELKMLRQNMSILQERANRVIEVLRATNDVMTAIEEYFQKEVDNSVSTEEFMNEIKGVLGENLNGLRSDIQKLRPPRRTEKQQKKPE